MENLYISIGIVLEIAYIFSIFEYSREKDIDEKQRMEVFITWMTILNIIGITLLIKFR
jgi:hypothetical protein